MGSWLSRLKFVPLREYLTVASSQLHQVRCEAEREGNTNSGHNAATHFSSWLHPHVMILAPYIFITSS